MAAAEQWEPDDARVSCPVLRERGGAIPLLQWANNLVWRRAMRSSQWMARVLCLYKALNFRQAHRARMTSMCLRVG